MDSAWSRGKTCSVKRNINHTRVENEEEIDEVFEFGRQLGQGSFGKVIEAINRATTSRFAIKSVNKEKAGSAAVKLLEREVGILKKVFHKHIIHLEEVYESSKKMFLVMELCNKGGLDELLKQRVRFNEKDTRCIMSQLVDAVVYLHENNIVHRDLKLENILLSDAKLDDAQMNIKITDFGLSYIRGDVGNDMMQQVCGTPMYMAPEVITNLGYSERCDVWSCGVLMYFLLHGGPPFVASTEEELHELIKKGELSYRDPHWDPVSLTAKNLIEWMMRVDPARRCSAKEVLNDSWVQGISSSSNGPRLNVLDLMGEELMRQKLEKSQIQSMDDNSNIENSELLSENSDQVNLPKREKSKDRIGRADKKVEPQVRPTDRKTDESPKSLPSYMQPTKSSKATRNPNGKDRRTKR